MKYFSLKEFRCDGKEIPPTYALNIQNLVESTLDPLREFLGVPIYVNSGYRTVLHNRTIESSAKKSLHQFGCAADIRPHDISLLDKAFVKLKTLPHTELIKYNTFIHVALINDKL